LLADADVLPFFEAPPRVARALTALRPRLADFVGAVLRPFLCLLPLLGIPFRFALVRDLVDVAPLAIADLPR
jgi:hypothetical protein